MQFFSWRCPFQRKLLFFQTIESAKRAFAARPGSRKFLKNEKQNSRKNYGATFSCSVQGHMQELSSFRGKTKNRPKKSLTWFLHAALQLETVVHLVYLICTSVIRSDSIIGTLGPFKSSHQPAFVTGNCSIKDGRLTSFKSLIWFAGNLAHWIWRVHRVENQNSSWLFQAICGFGTVSALTHTDKYIPSTWFYSTLL